MINASFTLLNPSAGLRMPYGTYVDADYEEIISHARSKGVGTAIYSPLSGGLLTDQVVSRGEFHPLARGLIDRQRILLEKAKALSFLSVPGEHSLAQAAVRFILMTEGVTTVLGGFSDTRQMEEIVAASSAGALSAELMTRVEMVWRSQFVPTG
jgi:L-glyceraldehyde 3-phosphate reductase